MNRRVSDRPAAVPNEAQLRKSPTSIGSEAAKHSAGRISKAGVHFLLGCQPVLGFTAGAPSFLPKGQCTLADQSLHDIVHTGLLTKARRRSVTAHSSCEVNEISVSAGYSDL
jgi:hypothetical protein